MPTEAVPRIIFYSPETELDDKEMEIDWRIPHPPYIFALPPVRRALPVASLTINRTEELLKFATLPVRHHRIHTAELSPYQRRVERVGNEPRDIRRVGLTGTSDFAHSSLPLPARRLWTIGFIAQFGTQEPSGQSPRPSSHRKRFGRSFEILKFSK